VKQPRPERVFVVSFQSNISGVAVHVPSSEGIKAVEQKQGFTIEV